MKRYTLSNEGRARFKQMQIRANTETVKIEGYEVLDYLYEYGPGAVEEIGNYTESSQGYVIVKLSEFINRGLVQKLADL